MKVLPLVGMDYAVEHFILQPLFIITSAHTEIPIL